MARDRATVSAWTHTEGKITDTSAVRRTSFVNWLTSATAEERGEPFDMRPGKRLKIRVNVTGGFDAARWRRLLLSRHSEPH